MLAFPSPRRPHLSFADVRDYGGFPSGVQAPPLLGRQYPVGYRHMVRAPPIPPRPSRVAWVCRRWNPTPVQCQFMSMLWYRALRGYKYAMRVDHDVCITRLPAPSLAAALAADYAYGVEAVETHVQTLETFVPWVDQYVASAGLPPQETPPFTDRIYFSHLFVSRIDWWEQPGVQRFLEAVNQSGGIYQHRWGDAPIQSAALNLHPNASVVHLDVDYTHLSTRNRVVAGEEVAFVVDEIPDEIPSTPPHLVGASRDPVDKSISNDRRLQTGGLPQSFPPAPPPSTYAAYPSEEKDEDDIGPIVGGTVGAVSLCVAIALAVLMARGKPLESSPLPSSELTRATFHIGRNVALARVPIMIMIIATYATLAGVGWGEYSYSNEVYNWVPSGGRYEKQLREWDQYVDDSVTDRTTAYIIIGSDNEGENLIDDPLRWLNVTYQVVKHVYTAATVSVSDRCGPPRSNHTSLARRDAHTQWDVCAGILRRRAPLASMLRSPALERPSS